MKRIVIVGAGQVGQSLAEALSADGHNVTVVDTRSDCLEAIESHLDVRTVNGFGSHPGVLEAAGAREAEMLIAVTDSDEVNMLACQIGSTLFGTGTKIARVRERSYHDYPRLFSPEAVPVDMLISPEAIVTAQIQRLVEHPGALQVLDFADGLVSLVGVRAYYGGPLVGHELRNLHRDMPGVQTRVAAIFRRDRSLRPDGHTVIEADDEVFFVAAKQDIGLVTSELRKLDQPYRRIMVAGGGNIGLRLAEALAGRYEVSVIERDPARAEQLRELLPEGTEIRVGDSADDQQLDRSGIGRTDVFCAVTNDDQANIFASMLAKRRGVRKVMALINRPGYVDLMQEGTIDIALSPQQATIGVLLARVREGGTATVHSLRRGAAEAIESIVSGDARSSRVVDRRIDELQLPEGATIGAVVRDREVLIPHHDTVIRSGDHVILFLTDRGLLRAVERLFQPARRFF
ncbi:Trk system potassium transporter TrkA [Thioalkalivibrio paradoxus]|uniref:Trk system potassium uptake protein TrkA n=1 Tax=Thioalkalivibrio paradoxus ARh 1 TaxID=713585 RepID=W0DRH1_9GAMM|nr:Trk system potassium transporter TrkA [Thioalkalivibrio paradoxus]AHE99460.1 potassium transporter peripheral membrane protein [Thioalkalivibrio paradoxus ARh 1]